MRIPISAMEITRESAISRKKKMKEGIEDKGKGMRKIRNRALGCRRKASQGQGLPGNKVNPFFIGLSIGK